MTSLALSLFARIVLALMVIRMGWLAFRSLPTRERRDNSYDVEG